MKRRSFFGILLAGIAAKFAMPARVESKAQSHTLSSRQQTAYDQALTQKRTLILGGRRSGKTRIAAAIAIHEFLKGNRVLYASPNRDQVNQFQKEVVQTLGALPRLQDHGAILMSGMRDANGLRGHWGDVLILDEFQRMNPNIWTEVGAPMIVDNHGRAVFLVNPDDDTATNLVLVPDHYCVIDLSAIESGVCRSREWR